MEGYGYIKELFVYDHTTDKPSHLDDIYFKKGDKYFKTTNINPGIFEGNFGFNSNLIVNCNITTNDIDTSNLTSEIANLKEVLGEEVWAKGKYEKAVEIFEKMSISPVCEEFLTLPAYEEIVSS